MNWIWSDKCQTFNWCDSNLVCLILWKYILKKKKKICLKQNICWLSLTIPCNDIKEFEVPLCLYCPTHGGPSHNEYWHQQGTMKKKSCTHYPLLQQYPEGCEKLSALNIKKECFHKAEAVTYSKNIEIQG